MMTSCTAVSTFPRVIFEYTVSFMQKIKLTQSILSKYMYVAYNKQINKFIGNNQFMIPIPICCISHIPAVKFCTNLNCFQNPFICKQCQNQLCKQLHILHQNDIKLWRQLSSRLQRVLQKQQSRCILNQESTLDNDFNIILKCLQHKDYGSLLSKNLGYFYSVLLEISVKNDHLKSSNTKSIQLINQQPKYSFKKDQINILDQLDFINRKKLQQINLEIVHNPGKAISYYKRGNIYQNIGNYEYAIKDYQKCIQLDKLNRQAYNHLEKIIIKLNKSKQMQQIYTRMIEADPSDSITYYKRGRIIYYSNNQFDKAFEDMNKAIKLDERYSNAYICRGIIHEIRKQFKKALDDYYICLQLNPVYTSAYHNIGITYYNLNNFPKSLEYYNKAIQYDYKHFTSYYGRALTYQKMQQYQIAIRDLSNAILYNPTYQQAFYTRGLLYHKKNQLKQALSDYNQTLLLNPKFQSVYYNIGNIYFQNKQYQKAMKAYQCALKNNQENKKFVHLQLGIIYFKIHKFEQSHLNFLKSIEEDSKNIYESYYYLGRIYLQWKQLQVAQKYFTHSLQIQPNFLECYLYKGIINECLENIDEAQRNYELGMSKDAFKYLKLIYQQIKKFEFEKDCN